MHPNELDRGATPDVGRSAAQAPSPPAIVVMMKAPQTGQVKTRLLPALTDAEAAALAACFAQDVGRQVCQIVRDVIVAYAPAEGRPLLEPLLPGDLRWVEQQGRNLGDRLATAIATAGACGFAPVLVLGTDSPTLPSDPLVTALHTLQADAADIALGPTEDGGYYLIALREPGVDLCALFHRVAWSTAHAYEQTADNAARLGLRLLRLPLWYDVDTPDDLLRLRQEIFTRQEIQARAPATHRWLRAHLP